jgi:hypothetical protein
MLVRASSGRAVGTAQRLGAKDGHLGMLGRLARVDVCVIGLLTRRMVIARTFCTRGLGH